MAEAAKDPGLRGGQSWQIDWKNPRWNGPPPSPAASSMEDSVGERVEGVAEAEGTQETVVGIASARVSPNELPEDEWRSLVMGNQKQDEEDKDHSDDPDDHWLLSVTLLSPKASGVGPEQDSSVAKEVLLELMRTPGRSGDAGADRTTETLASRRLVWPETSFHQKSPLPPTAEDDDSETSWANAAMLPWLATRLDASRTVSHGPPDGLVSAALCRRPPGASAAARAEDAQEIIASMGLGMAAFADATASEADTLASLPMPPSLTTTIRSAVSETSTTTHRREMTAANGPPSEDLLIDTIDLPKLYLACVTSGGLVCIYSPWDLLRGPKETQQSTGGSALWFLGEDLFGTLETRWKPLSEPSATISLGVLDPRWNLQHTLPLPEEDTPESEPEAGRHEVEDEDEESKDNSIPSLAASKSTRPLRWQNAALPMWNPWMESSTLRHRTVDNRALSVHAVPRETCGGLPQLVVLGQGTHHETARKRRLRRRRRPSLMQPKVPTSPKPSSKNPHASEWWKAEDSDNDEAKEVDSEKDHESHVEDDAEETERLGGFVTFCSVASWSETRTLFLDFCPRSVSHIGCWHGMELLLVVGDETAAAIRVDQTGTPVMVGTDEDLSRWEAEASAVGAHLRLPPPAIPIGRFHVLPVALTTRPEAGPSSSIQQRLLCGAGTTPPSLLQLVTEARPRLDDPGALVEAGLLLTLTFAGVTSRGAIAVEQAPGRVAQISTRENRDESRSAPLAKTMWGHLGQGWSLVGTGESVCFVCWEGTIESGGLSHLHQLPGSPPASFQAGPILPLPRGVEEARILQQRVLHSEEPENPRSNLTRRPSEDVVAEALQSMSDLRNLNASIRGENDEDDDADGVLSSSNRPRKSDRLLRHLSSWTELEDTQDHRNKLDRQVPIILVQGHRGGGVASYVLSLRQTVVDNGVASPFAQVLGWLSQRKDYFTAASIALDLLHDPDTLFHLWKSAEKLDEEDEKTKLNGLLDGIIPITENAEEHSLEESKSGGDTWEQLADMTVGCLLKGGWAMSKTLLRFLQINRHYDPGRASLMLVAATATAVSQDVDTVASLNEAGTQKPVHSLEESLWPLDCLLEIGVAREYMSTVLELLNATIPDELRRRPSEKSESGLPSLEMTAALIRGIVASHADSAELLLRLRDESTGIGFWQSLDGETQRTLALIAIKSRRPMLRQEQVRRWVLSQLHQNLLGGTGESEEAYQRFPSDWLGELVEACLQNAGCDLEDFILDPANISMMSIETQNSSDLADLSMDGPDGLFHHKIEIVEIRTALEPIPGSGGIDFDILIASLLLLRSRQKMWRQSDRPYVSTQSILDAVCYMAGRPGREEMFELNASRLMQQCALSGNVRAGAHLIGGRNGFILNCCDILMLELQVSMEDAEAFVLNERLDCEGILKSSANYQPNHFVLTDSHRHLLWLLDEHVLSIRTYGEFDAIQNQKRGAVDPIFCARSIFRVWLCLTNACKIEASNWMVEWLGARLGLPSDNLTVVSRHRLACAALVRVLLWPESEEHQRDGEGKLEESTSNDSVETQRPALLGQVLEIDNQFLIRLANSSCGLVESVPPSIAEGLVGMSEISSSTLEVAKKLGSTLRIGRSRG